MKAREMATVSLVTFTPASETYVGVMCPECAWLEEGGIGRCVWEIEEGEEIVIREAGEEGEGSL